jgi:hypothetical protein
VVLTTLELVGGRGLGQVVEENGVGMVMRGLKVMNWTSRSEEAGEHVRFLHHWDTELGWDEVMALEKRLLLGF